MRVVSGLRRPAKKLLPVFPADHRTASMSKSHQLSAGGAATKSEQRQDHPAGGTLVRVIWMTPPGGRGPEQDRYALIDRELYLPGPGLMTGTGAPRRASPRKQSLPLKPQVMRMLGAGSGRLGAVRLVHCR
jgi:hypothetical protein